MHCLLLGVQWDDHFVKQMRQEQGVPVAFPPSILGLAQELFQPALLTPPPSAPSENVLSFCHFPLTLF